MAKVTTSSAGLRRGCVTMSPERDQWQEIFSTSHNWMKSQKEFKMFCQPCESLLNSISAYDFIHTMTWKPKDFFCANKSDFHCIGCMLKMCVCSVKVRSSQALHFRVIAQWRVQRVVELINVTMVLKSKLIFWPLQRQSCSRPVEQWKDISSAKRGLSSIRVKRFVLLDGSPLTPVYL